MEERGPPTRNEDFHRENSTTFPTQNYPNHDDDPKDFQEGFGSGTYVVQVPKDQIYHVPPPEHAVFAERQRKLPRENKSSCSCCCVLVYIILILLILGLIGGIGFVLLKKDNPNFRIRNFLVRNQTSNSPNHHRRGYEYDITLASENRNQYTSIFYGEDGDQASLSFKDTELATGKYRPFDQEPKKSTAFKITLNGSNNFLLPKEIGKSMNSTKTKVNVDLSLRMKVPLRMTVGPLSIKSKTMSLLCNFKVDTMAKNTRVLSQDCQSTG